MAYRGLKVWKQHPIEITTSSDLSDAALASALAEYKDDGAQRSLVAAPVELGASGQSQLPDVATETIDGLAVAIGGLVEPFQGLDIVLPHLAGETVQSVLVPVVST